MSNWPYCHTILSVYTNRDLYNFEELIKGVWIKR